MTSPFAETWWHFDLCLGLRRDLLPVVADHSIAPSPSSQVKTLGKVPGRVVASGAVGFPNWTQHKTTPKEVDLWAADARLGVCLQTRRVRALDIDVNSSQAEAIATDFAAGLGLLPPIRHRRPASRKILLAFIVEGGDDDLRKRSFKTKEGLVELLATGQQFIVDSVHPDGSRYVWDGGLPLEFPIISRARFEAAWANIVDIYAVEAPYEAAVRQRKPGEHFEADDPTASYLVDRGLVLGEGKDGQLYVSCPWSDQHSVDSGVTEAAWLPAGTSSFECGHYSCLHASCAGRGDDEFREAVGCGTSSEFETLPAVAEARQTAARPRFMGVNLKTGEIPALLHNVMLALEHPGWFGYRVAYDAFLGEEVISFEEGPGWRPLRDADMALMRRRLDQLGFKPVGAEMMRSAIDGVTDRSCIDSAAEWLSSLEWDGVPRVETFLAQVFGAEDSAYTRAVSLYWWTALAGRVLAAPIQADQVPILMSPEGHYKTTTLQALVPSLDNYTKIDLGHRDPDISRKMRGVLIGEIEEMRGLQGRGGEGTKSFVTTQVEEWTPKYKEKKIRYARRLLLVGTTNDDDLFDGESGHRRWLPVRVHNADRAKAAAMRDQLWAEGGSLFRKRGIVWDGAHNLGREEIKKHLVEDMWEAAIAKWMAGIETEDGSFFTTAERVARGALLLDAKNHNKATRNRICKILREMGFVSGFQREEGAIVRGWRHASGDAFHNSVTSVSENSLA